MNYVYATLGISMDTMLLAVMARRFKRKRTIWQEAVSYLIYGLIVLELNARGTSVIIKFPACICLIMLIFTVIYDQIGYGAKIGVAILYLIILTIPEVMIVSAVLLSKEYHSVQELTGNPAVWLICTLAAKTLTYMVVIIGVKILASSGIRKRYMVLIQYGPWVMTGALLMLMAFLLININRVGKGAIVFVLGAVASVALIYTLAHNVFIQTYNDLQQKECENIVLQQKNKLQYEYYNEKLNTSMEMKSTYHDLKNILLILQKNKLDAEEITNRLTYLTKQYRMCMDTGNEMLDIALNQKCMRAEDARTELVSIIKIPPWYYLSDMDTCIVFGNLLDNAIEASVKVEQTDKRRISVKANAVEDKLLAIKICNNISDEGDTRRKNGIYLSSKKDKEKHGIGLRNVRETIEKYGGFFSTKITETKFEVSIIFFRKES